MLLVHNIARPSPVSFQDFITPEGNPVPIKQLLLILPSPSLGQPRISFLSWRTCLFWIFYINRILQSMALCVWLLSLSASFQDLSMLWHVPVLLSSHGWVKSNCNTPHFVYLFICWCTFGLLPSFSYCKQCCYERQCTSFCSNTCFQVFGAYTWEWDGWVIPSLTYRGNAWLFSLFGLFRDQMS